MPTVEIPHDPEADHAELRRYLGSAFDLGRLQGHLHAMADEQQRVASDDEFYRTSEAYLYDLTVFAMSGTKMPYLHDLAELVPPPARLLDYGCGIGSDGLRLLEAGYDVSFADFDNPSTRFLRWRLAQRGVEAPVYDLDVGAPPAGHDAVFCFDVIEHVEDPVGFLELLEHTADVVCVNFLAHLEGDTELHHSLPIWRLTGHAMHRGLLRYRRYHERSHVVTYRADAPRASSSLRSVLPLAVGAARARAGGQRLEA